LPNDPLLILLMPLPPFLLFFALAALIQFTLQFASVNRYVPAQRNCLITLRINLF
jgi:hypothetical protein